MIRNIVQKHLELNRPRVVHLTIRDPDYENEHYEDVSGLVEVQTIDIDLSGPFNGPKNFWVDMSEDDAREWLENHRTEVAHLPADSPVRKRVETLCADLEAGHP